MRAAEFVQVPAADEIVDEDSSLAMKAIKAQERLLKIKKARTKANDSIRALHSVEAKPATT